MEPSAKRLQKDMCQSFEVTQGCLNRSLLQLRTILDTYIMQRIESAPEDGCWRNIPQITEILESRERYTCEWESESQ
jgi:hypothetical protein